MDLVQVGLGRVGDEELAAAGVLPGMRHREGSRGVLVGVEVGLALDLVARPTGADPRVGRILRERIAALNHEVRDDAVEAGSIVELAVGQLFEIADGARHLGVEQLGLDGALAGFDSCVLGHLVTPGEFGWSKCNC